jgi:hypothetical protein
MNLTDLKNNYYAGTGTHLDANCNTNYGEYGDGAWVHYYICDDGTWKANGGCVITSCSTNGLCNGSTCPCPTTSVGIGVTHNCTGSVGGKTWTCQATCNSNGAWENGGCW